MRGIDLTNKQFGSWYVVEKAVRPPTLSKSKPLYWRCRCICGEERVIPAHNLRCKNTKSCGCENRLSDFESYYKKLLYSAKNRNLECELTLEQFLKFVIIDKCHYCYSPIQWKPKGDFSGYHIDRKNNSIGYSMDNCVVCCSRCNWSKNHLYSYEEWFLMNKCFRDKKSLIIID